ncbi:MAG: ABC transporter substrate-binding protein [Acidimicrobiales bacterium]
MRRSAAGPLIALAVAVTGLVTTPATASTRPPRSAGFPVTIQTQDGAVQITHRPNRILSLSPSATQMLYAIGAGDQVVGVDKYSTYPPNAPRTAFTGAESSAEGYLTLHPDLVILAFDSGHLVAQLNTVHVPTLLLAPATTISGAERQITDLGQATGHLGGAAKTRSALNGFLNREVSAAKGRGRGATYFVEIDQTYYSATSKTFIGAMLSRFGMKDIADAASDASSEYPQLSAEYVVKANPDYVFLADTVCCGQTASTFAKRPGFAALSAVRLHHVIGVNDSVASEWGPHSLESFVTIVAAVLAGHRSSG